MLKSVEEHAYHYLNQLSNWLESNGWAGWDPYDIYDNRIGMWMAKREKSKGVGPR